MATHRSPHRPRTLVPIPRIGALDYDVLDELIGYALRRAQVAMFLAFHQATRGLDITPPRFTALVVIGANPGISQSTLGKVLGIARSGAMALTDWFEARRLVERRRKPGDGRAWGLHLTRSGERFVARMKDSVVAEDRRRAAVLGVRERRHLLKLLNKLAG
jgi:DNA-binding MarR family transcriptional regulator